MTPEPDSKTGLTPEEQDFIKKEMILVNKLNQIHATDDLILESLKKIEAIIERRKNGRTIEQDACNATTRAREDH